MSRLHYVPDAQKTIGRHMARKRNEDHFKAAQNAARAIMLEEGYNAASYTSIAQRCGVARTTVQHYFPSKEAFATDIMNRIADVSRERAIQITPPDEPAFVTYYLTSQIAYGIFYLTEGTRRFLADICASRDLQHSAAPDYLGEAFEYLSIPHPSHEDYLDLQYSIGGIYEMHYILIRDGKVPDFAWLLKDTMTILARMAGVEEAERDRILQQYTIDNETLFTIGRELYDLALTSSAACACGD